MTDPEEGVGGGDRWPDLGPALDALSTGGTVLYPTRTLWGVGADARLPGSAERVARLKGRAPEHPFLLLVADVQTARELAEVPPVGEALMAALWPGDLTLLLPAGRLAPPSVVGPTGAVGLRVAQHPLAAALVKRSGAWLISTSANPSGQPPPLTLERVDPGIRDRVDAVLTGGGRASPAPLGTASTIVAVSASGEVTIVRQGAVPEDGIREVAGRSNLCQGSD